MHRNGRTTVIPRRNWRICRRGRPLPRFETTSFISMFLDRCFDAYPTGKWKRSRIASSTLSSSSSSKKKLESLTSTEGLNAKTELLRRNPVVKRTVAPKKTRRYRNTSISKSINSSKQLTLNDRRCLFGLYDMYNHSNLFIFKL